MTAGSQQTKYYWVCLRRPANPFARVTADNPMLVVDAMRFPYIDGTVTGSTVNTVYSAQRFQPYRGGHAVPVAAGTPAGGAAAQPTLDARYGYTEQIAAPTGYSNLLGTGVYYTGSTGKNSTPNPVFHTLGIANDQAEPWDYFPFHDRDFTGVAELMLVPGCPPGLFTKQFAEFAPSRTSSGNFKQVQPQSAPPGKAPQSYATAAQAFVTGSAVNPVTPHTFPYLVDKFFYTGASSAADTGGTLVGSPTGDGWFKMFEFFEVPGQMMGATGPVAQGTNFDWDRQDTKPGLLNLNLIIDEEVFFSVFGSQDTNFNQQLLSFDQLPNMVFPNGLTGESWTSATTPIPLAAGTSPIPLVVTATLAPPPGAPTTATGAPAAAYAMNNVGVVAYDRLTNTIDHRMKASFAQFLSLRHGGSGFVFGYGSGAVGQNFAVATSPANPNAPATPNLIPADRPFHSLSYPDIDFTVMRPATLPPSPFTNPPPSTDPTSYTADPGVRNPNLYPGHTTQNAPTGSVAASGTTPAYPGAIPVRRLFQVPDANAESNAGEPGEPFIDNQEPVPPATIVANAPPPAPGALPQFLGGGAGGVGEQPPTT